MTLRESQRKKIACYLKSGRSLTQDEAIRMFGCYRLSARIFELREQGMDIKTEIKTMKHREGDETFITQYGEYSL